MRMFSRFKSLSRAVHEEHQEELHHEERTKFPRIRSEGITKSTSLTVWRKSLVMNCKGFTVFDSCGNLVYRVDNYIGHPHEVVLMDATGIPLLTMCRRKKLGLVDSWFVYEGDLGNQGSTRKSANLRALPEKETPICCVKKHASILQGNSNVQAHVYRVASHSNKRCAAAFTVEGSYVHRTCKVLDEWGSVVAEIKRKEANAKNVSFGVEIFQLVVYPGFDPGFAMALVLLLDQMFS